MKQNTRVVRLKKHNWFIRLFSKEKRREHKGWKSWEALQRKRLNETIEVIPTKYEPSNLPPWYVLANYTYKNTKDTMSKHTQETWVTGYGYVKGIGEVFGVGIQTEPDWTPICILSPSEKVTETDEANGCLIAAAPEMLEALKALHHAVCGETGFAEAVRNCSGIAYPWEPLDAADLAARAAIAKAEGSQQ